MPKPRRRLIKTVKVRGLFGHFDYDMPRADSMMSLDPLAILYGDNGCGKTTVLRLLFHLFATKNKENHRSFLAGTRFRELEVLLSDGTSVWAKKLDETGLGTLTIGVRGPNLQTAEAQYRAVRHADGTLVVPADEPEDSAQTALMESINSLGLTLYLLSDDRKVDAAFPSGAAYWLVRRAETEWHLQRRFAAAARVGEVPDPEQIAVAMLEMSVERMVLWIRNHVLTGSERGESNVNSLYEDIVTKIAHATRANTSGRTKVAQLTQTISALAARYKPYASLGFMPPFSGERLIEALSSGKQSNLLASVLEPYLEGIEAKLNALADIEARTRVFVESVNSFLVFKRVHYSMRDGLRMLAKDGSGLPFRALSSGERHLLLLFCNTLVALDNPSVMLVDEPEISLNVKWQRRLVGALVECSKGSPVQFIMASHSMELLSKHSDRVVRLQDTLS
jgi:energy-coupling factor transporter ATP-binding protein EcfA2